MSWWLGGPDGTALDAHDAERAFYAASTVKLPLAVAAHRLHEAGRLDLDAPVPVHDAPASALPGARVVLDPADDQEHRTWAERGGDTSLRTLLRRTVALSGNLAAALVLEHVGLEAVRDVLLRAGCSPTTRIERTVGDGVAREAGLDNVVCARDLGLVLAALAGGRLLGAAATDDLLADLRAQVHRGGIAAGLPAGLDVAGKPGWVDGLTHDTALVHPCDHPPLAVVVLTEHGHDRGGGEALVARTAAGVWSGLEARVGRPLRGAP